MSTLSLIKRAAAIVILFLTGCDALFISQPASNPEAVFEDLWRTFDTEAANLEERKVDWAGLYARYRPGVTPHTTDADLFAILTELLSHIDDSHVGLTAPHQMYFNANRIYREKIDSELFDLPLIQSRYLEADLRSGASYLYGRIKGQDLAYAHFGLINAATMSALSEMIETYPDAAGYIIDLRRNNGGNHTFAFDAMGRFTDRTRYVFRSRTRNGPGRKDYTPWHDWHLKPSGTYINRPIMVLTDRYTPSAGERMVMAFKSLPNATIMGDTTSGTFGTKIPRELANGWYYTLSVQKVEMFDGRSYEGTGLAPDYYIKNTTDEIRAGFDRTLQTAIDAIAQGSATFY